MLPQLQLKAAVKVICLKVQIDVRHEPLAHTYTSERRSCVIFTAGRTLAEVGLGGESSNVRAGGRRKREAIDGKMSSFF